MKIPHVKKELDELPPVPPSNADLATFFKMFIEENRRIDTRMLALENKFDRLLEAIDGRMEQLITVLVDRSQAMIPVSTFTKILFAVIIAIFVAMFGKDVVVEVCKGIIELFKEFKAWYFV